LEARTPPETDAQPCSLSLKSMGRVLQQMLCSKDSAQEEEVQESLRPGPAAASDSSGEGQLLLQAVLAPVASALLEPMLPASTVVSMNMDSDSEFTQTSVPAVYSWELSSV
jgi:hypothetical protein